MSAPSGLTIVIKLGAGNLYLKDDSQCNTDIFGFRCNRDEFNR